MKLQLLDPCCILVKKVTISATYMICWYLSDMPDSNGLDLFAVTTQPALRIDVSVYTTSLNIEAATFKLVEFQDGGWLCVMREIQD